MINNGRKKFKKFSYIILEEKNKIKPLVFALHFWLKRSRGNIMIKMITKINTISNKYNKTNTR